MLGMDRFWIELAGVVVLIGALAGWWMEHNRHEQTVGATACLTTYTETKEIATVNTAAIDNDRASILQRVSDAYIQQIADLNADRDGLAQRLHDRAAKDGGRSVPGVSTTACNVRPAGNNTGPTERDRREAADLEACAQNTIELNAMRAAWAGMAAKQPHPP